MACSECKYWQRYNVAEGYKNQQYGACRFQAPRPLVKPDGQIVSPFPRTHESMWCGDFEEKK